MVSDTTFSKLFRTSNNLEIKILGHDLDQSDLVYEVRGYFLDFRNTELYTGYSIKQCCYFF